MRFSDSVFLRDAAIRDFLFGTTDVLVGSVSGRNVIEDVDFVRRAEFESVRVTSWLLFCPDCFPQKRQSPTPASFPQAPDGCAIDFETAATGFQVSNCTFYRSWGAGIMIYGHDTTSQDLLIADNTFIQAGCTQTGDDRGGISAVCPGGAHPSGKVRFQNGCEARSPDNGFLPRTEWAHRLPCHPPTF